jgi:hypothetical protein
MLIFFSVAGPFIETRELFLYQVHQHETLAVYGPPALYGAALIVRFIRWRNPPWLATFRRLFWIIVIAALTACMVWLIYDVIQSPR